MLRRIISFFVGIVIISAISTLFIVDCGAIPIYDESFPSLSLSTPNTVMFNAQPDDTPTITSKSTSIKAETNATKGYKLTLHTSTIDTCLKHQTHILFNCADIDDSLKLKNTTTNTNTLSTNSWGISLDNSLSWQPVPDSLNSNDLLIRQTNIASIDDIDVDIGVSATKSLAAGTYSGSITYTAVANIIPQPELFDINLVSGTTGDMLIINGLNLDSTYNILIGDMLCVSGEIVSNNQLSCRLPDDEGQFQEGDLLDIVVETWGGDSILRDALLWKKSGSPPTISDVNKNKQPFIGQVVNDANSIDAYLLSLVMVNDIEDDAAGIPISLEIDSYDGFNPDIAKQYSIKYKAVDSDGNEIFETLIVEVWNFTKIVNGMYHAVILGSNGSVWTFGYNVNGQRGQGSTAPANTFSGGSPTIINQSYFNNLPIIDIAAGFHTSCALNSSGNAYCWGLGTAGNLGNGETNNSSLPVAVNMPSGVTFSSISGARGTNNTSSFAGIGSDGNVYTWGSGAGYKLGTGSQNNRLSPTKITTTGDIVKLSQGSMGGVAANASGQVYVWGANGNGQLANGNTIAANAVTSLPHIVNNVTDVIELSYGGYGTNGFILGLTSEGTVYHWGWNYGRNGSGTNTTVVSKISTISNVKQINAGADFSQFTVENDLYSVGYSNYGEAFTGGATTLTSPTKSNMSNIVNNVGMAMGGYENAYVLSKDGKMVYTIGYSNATDREFGSNTVYTTSTNIAVPWTFTPLSL